MSADALDLDDVPSPPTFLYRPPRVRSLLPKVLKVCASVGRMHEPEQALAVDVLTGIKADGAPASLEAGVVCSRQNLKTYCLENILLTRLVDPTDTSRLFIWTSQQIDTCEETFVRLLSIFESDDFPHMRRRFKRSVTTNGKQQIEMADGRRVKFKARSEKSGQGLTGDVIVFDEAFALEDEHLAALLPTLSTRHRATVLYGSSAGHASSAVLRRLRDRGRAGGHRAPAYVEWCAPGSLNNPGCLTATCQHSPGTPGCVMDREDFWLAANPMAGRRITWEYLRDERNGGMSPEKFARERLGWWDDPGDEQRPISADDWMATTLPELDRRALGAPSGRLVFVLDVPPGMRSAVISASGALAGKPHSELAAAGPGTEWVPAKLVDLAAKHPGSVFAFDSTGSAGALVPAITAAGVDMKPLSSKDMQSGAAHIQALSLAHGWTHTADPILDAAFSIAVKRDVGDGGWDWGRRKAAGDISPMRAVTGGQWLLEKHQEAEYDLLDSAW